MKGTPRGSVGKKERRPNGVAPRRASGWRRAFPALIAVVLVLGGAVAVLLLRRRPPPAAPPPAPVARDPAAGMSAIEAGRNAARLYREGRAYESLPFYRRVAREMPADRLDFHIEFADALEHASLQARLQSRERVRLMMECIDQLGRIEGAVRAPHDRSQVIVSRAFFLRVWGFPMDAVTELRRARETDPSNATVAAMLRLMERRVREPTLPLDALETEPPAP
jgi:hypothetical protein